MTDPRRERASGVLLHVTSLPGRYGVGELGPEAAAFARSLHVAGQRVWQMLPLGPVFDDGCPYRTESVFAGSPLLVSTDRLVEDGLVTREETGPLRELPAGRADYPRLRQLKGNLLRTAFSRFGDTDAVRKFGAQQEVWLDDYALFAALRAKFGGAAWTDWPAPYAHREPEALARARAALAEEIEFVRFVQYRFAADLAWVRAATASCDVALVADLPFYPSADSADVWAHPRLFRLTDDGAPIEVAGAPPDYFSADGQIWGNVLYDWDAHRSSGFRWWLDRIAHAASTSDIVRFDHFRGFDAYWAVPAAARSAREGQWRPGPKQLFFDAVREHVGDIAMIADDLGSVTDEVDKLRSAAGLPGMKVLQFTRAGDGATHLPYRYEPACVVYTGTHDNETTDGWWAHLGETDRSALRSYFGDDIDDDVCWRLTQAAMASVANLAIVPVQDLRGLGNEARMNEPGVEDGCWTWRLVDEPLTTAIEFRLFELVRTYGRLAHGRES